jgi:Cu/Ag efflux protein CusF
MKKITLFSILLNLTLSFWLPANAHAQETIPETETPSIGTSTEMTEGEVRKIDKANKKITIKHSEITNLDMPGMTMVFQVKDPLMLDTLKAGDKVKFRVEKVGGAMVITDIQSVK